MFESQPGHTALCGVLCLTSIAALGLAIGFTRKEPTYDEPRHLSGVALLDRYGLSTTFLRELPGAPGPLYAVLHRLLKPLTHLRPPGIRLVNFGLFAALLVVLSATLRFLQLSPWFAVELIGIPMVWAITGLALTEIPAIFFGAAAIWLLFLAAFRDRQTFTAAIVRGAAGGILFGIAVVGRQPLLTVIPAVPLLFDRKRRNWPVLAAFLLGSLALPVWVFSVWHGLVPPKTPYVGEGLSVKHAIQAFAYAAMGLCILSPKYLWLPPRWLALILPASLVLNGIWGWIEITPMQSSAANLLPAWGLPIYSAAASAALLGLGALFVVSSARNFWDRRQDPACRFVIGALVLLLGSCATQPLHFSSRYVAVGLPMLLLAAAPYTVSSWWKCARLLAGIVLGAISLWSYLRFSVPVT